MAALEVDHRSMLPMFFTPPPPLGDVLEKLTALEARIRALPPSPLGSAGGMRRIGTA